MSPRNSQIMSSLWRNSNGEPDTSRDVSPVWGEGSGNLLPNRQQGVASLLYFCVGTGTGHPTGIFTANGGTIGVTAGSSITVDNLIDLIYALKSPYRRNAAFLLRDVTVSSLRKLKDSNGAYLWQPSVQAGQPDRLLGYPIYTSPY